MSNSDGSDSDEDTSNEKLSSMNEIQVIFDVQSDRIDHVSKDLLRILNIISKFCEMFPGIHSSSNDRCALIVLFLVVLNIGTDPEGVPYINVDI